MMDEVSELVKTIPETWSDEDYNKWKLLDKFREKIKLLKQLRSIGSDTSLLMDELNSDKYQQFHVLGWIKETKERAM
jgi:hypothetical protein